MQKTSYFRFFYSDFILSSVLFLVHRSLTFSMLNGGVLEGLQREAQGFFVGALSDLWVAALLALVLGVLWQQLLKLTNRKFTAALRYFWIAIFTLGLASHQSYVEFFGFPMMVFHLRYLYDSAFIAANGRSLLNWSSLIYAAVPCILLLLKPRRLWVKPGKHARAIFFSFLFLLLLLHNRNIHWRVQWFIPENLQTNVIEKLFGQLRHAQNMNPIQATEKARLRERLGVKEESGQFQALLKAVKEQHQNQAQPPLTQALQAQWQQAIKLGKKPIVAVVLMESLRPSETGYFHPSGLSLTPELDRLAQESIVFRRAFSTGSVTRGGQEAVFCGHFSSRDTSLMRYDAIATIHCLPDFLSRTSPQSVESFWYHGGNGLFDNQISFWRKHGIQQIFSEDLFPPQTPRTSWGVGDISFLNRAAEELKQLQRTTQSEALLGILLTVSNHIPWDMPADIIPYALPLQVLDHPSYRTTAYTDRAIGAFVRKLKRDGLWEHTLLFLVSDHGNQVPAYADIYQESDPKSTLHQSHINLLMTGGLVQSALQQNQLVKLDKSDLVSQVDISQIIAETLGVHDFVGMGEDPFREPRILPVLSRLEQTLFDPKSGATYSPAQISQPPADEKDELSLSYYRQYLEYITSK